MIGNIFKVLISVKAKLFFGFLAMAMIILGLGGYAYVSTSNAGAVVEDTFDRPLMAINFARSAGQVFSQLEIDVIEQLQTGAEQQTIDPASITPLLSRFKADLKVSQDRSIAPKAVPFFKVIETELAQWEQIMLPAGSTVSAASITKAQTHADIIEQQLDIIVELQTGQSFLAREAAIARMDEIKKYNLWAGIAALTLTLLLSAWISVTIIAPLKAAAAAARKISAGDFNVDIPPGGDDETGVLLKTMSSMQRNIRDRMGQEQNLRALAQHRLSDSVTNSRDAILLTDTGGVIIVSNPQIGQMFPALADFDLIQRPFSNYFDETGAPLNEPCQFNSERREIKFNDGRWARVSASKTQEGGRLFIWSDITEAKIRSQNLLEAKEAAEAADKAKTLFLAAMSHELRTPLNAVIGFSDIIKSHYDQEGKHPDHAEMAGLISQSGAHLLNIVKDVLSVADGNAADNLNMDLKPVEMADVVNFCMKTIASEAEKNNVQLLWKAPVQPIPVYGDELRLQQLLLNLLSNAIKYNRDNGRVRVALTTNDKNAVCLDVIDSGIGIDKADLDRIMEPFVQVDSGFTRKYDGVGLGLSIVKQILTPHKGRIFIRSKVGHGTVVRIVLPALMQSQRQQSNP
ncbi:ATP-binding protein [Fretibacter rubidus]|uniref:sensor histidine kinase n=1 Tax=Fretibacter rubidus TaxID=570162 RepID=UPI00352B6CD9